MMSDDAIKTEEATTVVWSRLSDSAPDCGWQALLGPDYDGEVGDDGTIWAVDATGERIGVLRDYSDGARVFARREDAESYIGEHPLGEYLVPVKVVVLMAPEHWKDFGYVADEGGGDG